MGMERADHVLIEGYASLFGVADLAGDVVRAGAFARTLAVTPLPAMLFQHAAGRMAGRWTRLQEDGRGLFARGLVHADTVSGRAALDLIRAGRLSGLSIGFRALDWSPNAAGGRDLRRIELREVSLVAHPLLPGARFAVLGARNARKWAA